MLNVSNVIDLILKKKGWSKSDLCRALNKLEARLGEARTSIPVITGYFNDKDAFRPKVLAKWEIALDLPEGTLMKMVAPPITKEGKEELKNTIERLRKLR